jgi:anaerobic magnesium-protoporphyrin IX monomethyl ester cyclase
MRRVLFVHPRKDTAENPVPHLGLASLAAVLRRAGHEALILDEVLYPPGEAPDLAAVIADFRPDVVGVSAYTSTLDRTLEVMRRAREACEAPILVGGPHATLFAEQVAATGPVDIVVRGEAEEAIVSIVEGATRREQPTIVDCPLPDPGALPWPDYSALVDPRVIQVYPVMTSRGCPYACSFCAVRKVSSQKWRARDPEDCAAEIAAARAAYPTIASIKVSDDCPTGSRDHFKNFLRRLAEQTPLLPLTVDNMRADRVDDELVELMKAAGATSMCLGVESGNPEVFALVNKGETLDDIRRAAGTIKRHGLELVLCFVIGLPGDTYRRSADSVRLAKELGAGAIFWNMAHPFPGTEMYGLFEEAGATIDPPRAYTSYDTHKLEPDEPAVETPEFTKWERRRAYFRAVVETDQYHIHRAQLPKLLVAGWRYRVLGPAVRSFLRMLGRGLRRRLARPAGKGAP